MTEKGKGEEFTKYEVARILGARALQVAMDAPILLKISDEELEKIKYDPIKIAEKEFLSGVLPISVKRPFPKKKEMKLKREIVVEKKPEKEDKEIIEKEKKEEKEIVEEGEIMEMARPEDEIEETVEEEEGVEE